MRRVAAMLAVTALLAAPAAAPAQVDPFGPLPPPAPQPTPVPEPADDGGGGGGDIGRTTLVLIGLGVLAAFFGIGWAITRDARRSLTDRDRQSLERQEEVRGERTKAARADAKRRARQKAKAQRAARRRNR